MSPSVRTSMFPCFGRATANRPRAHISDIANPFSSCLYLPLLLSCTTLTSVYVIILISRHHQSRFSFLQKFGTSINILYNSFGACLVVQWIRTCYRFIRSAAVIYRSGFIHPRRSVFHPEIIWTCRCMTLGSVKY